MFGKGKPLREGANASGVVVETVEHMASSGGGMFQDGLSGLVAGSHIANRYRATIRVTFDDGSTAEKSLDVKRDEVGGLRRGDIVPVRYDPTDHSKLELDIPALAARRAEVNADRADLKRLFDEGGSSNPKADLIRLSIVQAKRKGDAAEVERLTAMLADLDHVSASEPTAQ